jgi:hypothetical protein
MAFFSLIRANSNGIGVFIKLNELFLWTLEKLTGDYFTLGYPIHFFNSSNKRVRQKITRKRDEHAAVVVPF